MLLMYRLVQSALWTMIAGPQLRSDLTDIAEHSASLSLVAASHNLKNAGYTYGCSGLLRWMT